MMTWSSEVVTVAISNNLLLYGPPGTGKTYNTVNYAVAIIEGRPFEEVRSESYAMNLEKYDRYTKMGRIDFMTFHQSLGYDDFIEGIKPVPAGEDGWVAWYTEEEEVLYILAGGGEAGEDALLTTARQIMNRLGYDMDVAPASAKNVMYITFTLDPGDGTESLETAETSFTVDGIRYAYRTAGTGQPVLQDISGVQNGAQNRDYENHSSVEIGWCAAEAFWTEGGAGKLIWLDLAPGLVYSLTMDTGASEKALTEMAQTLYTPAQGDVG